MGIFDEMNTQTNKHDGDAKVEVVTVAGGTANPFEGLQVSAIDTSFDAKPAGDYPVKVDYLQVRTTQKGGIMATMAYKIIGGERYVNGFEFRPFFFNVEDKEQLNKDLGKLALAIKEATGSEEEKSKAAALQVMQQFYAGGKADIKITDWFANSTGTLTLKHREYDKKDGTKGNSTSYKFALNK